MAKVLPALCGSREQNKERTFLVCVGLVVLCGWLWVPTAADVQPTEMFLNKPRDCGHGDSKVPWYRVNHESLYNIQDDMSPHTRTTTFLECTMVFRSPNKDGRLCVFQRTLDFLTDSVELRLYDKYVTDPDMKPTKVVNDETGLREVEWCTSGQFLTLEMGKRMRSGSVQDVEIDLLIYHISSVHRTASMDTTPFCDSRYQMDNSRVRVTSTELGMKKSEESIHPKCSLHFDYSGQDTRNLCLIFDPNPSPGADNTAQCKFNYTLHVYEQGSSVPALSLGGCGEQVQRRWCSNSTTNTTDITLMLDRHYSGVEDGILFEVLMMDHHGGASTLPLLPAETDEASINGNTIIIMVACIGAVLLLMSTVIIVFIVKRQQTKKPKARSNGDSSHRMLAGKDDERQNRQNIYTGGYGGRNAQVV